MCIKLTQTVYQVWCWVHKKNTRGSTSEHISRIRPSGFLWTSFICFFSIIKTWAFYYTRPHDKTRKRKKKPWLPVDHIDEHSYIGSPKKVRWVTNSYLLTMTLTAILDWILLVWKYLSTLERLITKDILSKCVTCWFNIIKQTTFLIYLYINA